MKAWIGPACAALIGAVAPYVMELAAPDTGSASWKTALAGALTAAFAAEVRLFLKATPNAS